MKKKGREYKEKGLFYSQKRELYIGLILLAVIILLIILAFVFRMPKRTLADTDFKGSNSFGMNEDTLSAISVDAKTPFMSTANYKDYYYDGGVLYIIDADEKTINYVDLTKEPYRKLRLVSIEDGKISGIAVKGSNVYVVNDTKVVAYNKKTRRYSTLKEFKKADSIHIAISSNDVYFTGDGRLYKINGSKVEEVFDGNEIYNIESFGNRLVYSVKKDNEFDYFDYKGIDDSKLIITSKKMILFDEKPLYIKDGNKVVFDKDEIYSSENEITDLVQITEEDVEVFESDGTVTYLNPNNKDALKKQKAYTNVKYIYSE